MLGVNGGDVVPPSSPGGAYVDIETKTVDGVKLVKLKGRLAMGPPLDRFNAALNELLSQGQNRIVLDLEEVPTIDSSGIGMLVRHLTAAKQSGGAIRLLNPSKFTVQTLKMVGLLNLFTTFDDSKDAVASFQ
jgi:anti-sigma B factor antagonist